MAKTKTTKTARTTKTSKVKKASAKKVLKKKVGKALSMDDLLKKSGYEFNVPKHGTVVEGLVTELSKKIVLVDIGGKTEGMVVDREYEAAYGLIQKMKVGDKIRAIVVSPENDRGQILLSLKREASRRAWEHYKEMMKKKEIIVVRGLEVNRGGLIVAADGTRGFIPSSQFSKKLTDKMDELISRPIKVRVVEVDREKNRLIFSERHVSEAGILEQKGEALKTIKEGAVLEGVVSGVMKFGAFVTVQVPLKKGKKSNVVDIDGLVHISEISWMKVTDPNEHFRVGEKVKVKVISVDKGAKKLNLSVKRLGTDPWDGVDKKYKIGSKQVGIVTRVEPFGVFVNFEPGIDGLIHISKIPAGEEHQKGKKVNVYVETIDKEHRRMSLAMVLKTMEKLIYK